MVRRISIHPLNKQRRLRTTEHLSVEEIEQLYRSSTDGVECSQSLR